ncbi:MAG: hypothetical protein WA624_24695, partial [Methylocella sp.]
MAQVLVHRQKVVAGVTRANVRQLSRLYILVYTKMLLIKAIQKSPLPDIAPPFVIAEVFESAKSQSRGVLRFAFGGMTGVISRLVRVAINGSASKALSAIKA